MEQVLRGIRSMSYVSPTAKRKINFSLLLSSDKEVRRTVRRLNKLDIGLVLAYFTPGISNLYRQRFLLDQAIYIFHTDPEKSLTYVTFKTRASDEEREVYVQEMALFITRFLVSEGLIDPSP